VKAAALRPESSLLAVLGLGFLTLLVVGLVVLRLDPLIVLALCVGAAILAMLTVEPLVSVHIIVALLYCETALVNRQGVTAMSVIGPVILGTWMVNMLLRRQNPFRVGALGFALLAFVTWCSLSLFYAYDVSWTWLRFGTLVQLSVFCLMCIAVLNDLKRILTVCWAMVWWSGAACLYGQYAYATGLMPMVTGPGENRNHFALFLVISCILAFLLGEQTKRLWLRSVLRFVMLPLYLVSLALTFSRTGYIALVVAWMCLAYRFTMARRIWPVIAMALGLALVSPFLPDVFYARFKSIVPALAQERDEFGRQSDTFYQRVNIWQQGLEMVEAHPITGIGLGNFMTELVEVSRGKDLSKRIAAHSTYVGLAAETGLVGLTLYLFILGLTIRSARRAFQAGRRLRRFDVQMVGAMVEAGILVTMTWSISNSSDQLKMVWLLYALGNSAEAIASAMEAAKPQPAAAPAA
jgi:O-antigen ligase